MKQKPGVMIYFATWACLDKLNDKELAAMFRGIMNFGMTGERPVFSGKAAVLWPLVEYQLVADDDRYYQRKAHGAYGIYVRWQKKNGQDALPYEEWYETKYLPEESKAALTDGSYTKGY